MCMYPFLVVPSTCTFNIHVHVHVVDLLFMYTCTCRCDCVPYHGVFSIFGHPACMHGYVRVRVEGCSTCTLYTCSFILCISLCVQMQYSKTVTHRMCDMLDIPQVSSAIIWARQVGALPGSQVGGFLHGAPGVSIKDSVICTVIPGDGSHLYIMVTPLSPNCYVCLSALHAAICMLIVARRWPQSDRFNRFLCSYQAGGFLN